MIIERSVAEGLVGPYFDQLTQCKEEAWMAWRNIAHTMQHPRFRANHLWNSFMYHAGLVFSGSEDVKVTSMGEHGSRLDGILFGRTAFVRFKKANERLLSSNVATQSAMDFHDQQRDLYDGIGRLELVYSLNDFGGGIDRFALIQRHKQSIVWSIDIDRESDSGQMPIPLVPPTSSPGTPASRIIKTRIASDETQKHKRGDSGS